jgi:transcriptional regulator with XRE-family HTH domain
MLIGERIRSAREAAGMTRSLLARRVGVQPSAASQWERVDGTAPSVENLARVALVTNVTFEWLATGRGSPRGAEKTALDVANFAQDLFEERLLQLGRKLRPLRRDLVLRLLEELSR